MGPWWIGRRTVYKRCDGCLSPSDARRFRNKHDRRALAFNHNDINARNKRRAQGKGS